MSDHCVLIESALMQTNCLLKSYANSLFNKTEIIPQASQRCNIELYVNIFSKLSLIYETFFGEK